MRRARSPCSPLLVLLAALAAAGATACDDAGGKPEQATATGGAAPAAARGEAARSELPPTARPELVEDFRRARALPRDPSDGGGRGRAYAEDGGPPVARAGRPGRWKLVYEAGPLGIEPGGFVHFQTPPFWNWSDAQASWPEGRGYTTVETDAAGVELSVEEAGGGGGLFVLVQGRKLEEGEHVTFLYGAGPARALADRYAEHGSRFWFRVDGDGDGNSAVVADSPAVDVLAGPPVQMVLTVPSTAAVGELVRVTVALLDPVGNTGFPFEGEVRFLDPPAGLELPESVALSAADLGRRTIEVRATAPGLHRLRAEATASAAAPAPGDGEDAPPHSLPIRGESNPLLVGEGRNPILWGDIHGHSGLSDGTGSVEDYLTYARDVSALDVIALTDHDHWGVRFLDENPDVWEHIQSETKRFHEPGRFVTLLGFEWTNWIYGHRHVLYFQDDGEVISSIDEETETPTQLWDALRGLDALTFAHHSAGGPIATDWSFAPDPVLEPVTEVVSVHGVSESSDAPARSVIYNPLRGNFVRDALDEGYRLGFVGSGDSHDGHPGLPQLAAPSGGLAAILAEENTREAVLAALRARRVYATNGARILLRTALDGHRMGALLPAPPEGRAATLVFSVIGTGPIESIDVIRRGETVTRYVLAGELEAASSVELEGLASGEYVYVRVIQSDGGLAWSSPFFVE